MRILAAMFQGGGNVNAIMPIISALIACGHDVRIMAGPGVRTSRLPVSTEWLARIQASGAAAVPFTPPEIHPFDGAPPAGGVVAAWVPSQFRVVQREARTAIWALAWATNMQAELRRAPADLVLADFVLVGALAAAEAANVPAVALVHQVWPRPIRGMPPYGPGYLPASGTIGWTRDTVGRIVVSSIYRKNALSPLNTARIIMGLRPLRCYFRQYDNAARVLILMDSCFDYASDYFPANVRHVGSPVDNGSVTPWVMPWSPDDRRPLILVALSTLEQGQAGLMQRILLALGGLIARVLVTLGPALDPRQFEIPPGIRIERFVPHSQVLPHASVVVTQCGLGTVTKSLRNGVPLVCIPLVGDQPETAARVIARGAGIRLSKNTDASEIRQAVDTVLHNKAFGVAADVLAKEILHQPDATERARREIEAILETV